MLALGIVAVVSLCLALAAFLTGPLLFRERARLARPGDVDQENDRCCLSLRVTLAAMPTRPPMDAAGFVQLVASAYPELGAELDDPGAAKGLA